MLEIYGTPNSRTFRTLWLAGELGIPYENIPLDFRKGETKTDTYLKLNPNARIPTIKDGDFVLWESMAISFYLSKKHPGPLTPKTPEEEALTLQWSFWALTECEPPIVNIMRNRLMLPEDQRDEASAKRSEEMLKQPFAVLEGVLSDRSWVLGNEIKVADINLAGVLSTALRIQYDLAPYPKVAGWIDRCMSRPAAVAAAKMRAEAAAA